MFSFLKNTLKSVYSQFTQKVNALFGQNSVDEDTLKELEELLLKADTGVTTTRTIISNLKNQYNNGTIKAGVDLKESLEKELIALLPQNNDFEQTILFLVGVNGSGKTTAAGKLAYRYAQQNKKVLLVAADTFRAAAVEQLQKWAENAQVDIVTGTAEQDPGSVVYEGCSRFHDENYDVMIIDTAGRLQTKTNLMNELAKLKRIIAKKLPNTKTTTLLTIDSMLGQNSFEQAKLFNECTQTNGIILTKMDGTGKGGIVFAINNELNIPVHFISFGENIDQIKPFDSHEYVSELLSN